MNCLLALLSTLVVFASVQAHAVHQPAGEVYLNKVLPNTPIPTAIKELITPPVGSAVSISKRGISLRTIKPQTTENNLTRAWGEAATEAQVSDYKDASFFFFEKDLQPGNKFTKQFSPATPPGETLFISHEEANSVPFSSAKFPDILTHFSVQPNSVDAKIMYQTLKECEKPGMNGESKCCATSLESMVEFSMASLGTRNIQAVSTNVYVDTKENANSAKQQYTITSSSSPSRLGFLKRLKFEGPANNVVCHAMSSYAYAVFYCHLIRETKAYQVSMVGEDGTKVETVAVCHMDTAKFHPKHIAFTLLHVKPGTVPICHFLAQDSLVWAPKTNYA